MSRMVITVVLGALGLFPAGVMATEGPAQRLVQRLLEAPQLKEELVAAAGRTAASRATANGTALPNTASEIAVSFFRSDDRIWKALASDLPPYLAQRIPQDRLEALAKSYAEDPGRAWNESGAELLGLTLELMTGGSQFAHATARSACSVGFLAPNIDEAKKKKGTADKPFKAPPDFFQQIQPLVQPIDESCDCIARHFIEAWKQKTVSDETPREESGAWAAQLIQSGKCPDPFAGSR